jgi:hypothetical protein
MKKNYFIALVAGSFILLASLQSCRHESLETEIVNVQKDPILYIKNEYMRGKNMVAGKEIEWDKARKYKNEQDIILITVPVKSQGNNLIEELSFRIDNNKVSGHLWKFKSDLPFSSDDYKLTAHEIMNNMTGTVSYVALEGSMRYEKKIVRGKFIDEVAKNGSGAMDAPSCRGCHDKGGGLIGTPQNPIDTGPVVITPPGPKDPFPTPIPGGVGGGTNPQNPENPNNNNDPCKKIKEQKAKPEFNQKINDLKNKTDKEKETGYIQKADGSYQYKDQASTNEGSNSLSLPKSDLPENKDITGYMHTHVNDRTFTNSDGYEETRTGIKMFSPADVGYFMDMLSNAQAAGRPLGDVYAIMVSSSGTYEMRFTGNQYQIKTFTAAQIKGFKDSYTNAMINSENKTATFLNFLSEKMNIKGTNLYKYNPDGPTEEIKLDKDKKTTTTTDCPN